MFPSIWITYALLALHSGELYAISPQSIDHQRSLGVRKSRSAIDEWPSFNEFEPEGPGSYAFGFEVEDPTTGNRQYRNERRTSLGTVTGSYGVYNADGSISTTDYMADHQGYRPKLTKRKADEYSMLDIKVSENHQRPSSSLSNKKNDMWDSSEEHEKKVLFAFPVYQTDNGAFFEKNSKLASLFFSDEYMDLQSRHNGNVAMGNKRE